MAEALTRAEAQGGLQTEPVEEDSEKAKALVLAARETVELDGRKKFFWLRTKWSWVIVVWTTLLIWFNCYLAYKIGVGEWKFDGYQWFITAVTVETFLQIVGMGYVAVRFLFSRG